MRTPLLAAVAAVLLLSAGSACAKELLAHEKYQLANGLTVILHEDHDLPQVVTNIWYHCGTREEPPGRSGFAHLFEHLMFMGTQRVPDNQFDVIMEGGGGANNASTWFDRTNYYCWGPARMLPTLLWLEADRMEGLGVAMTQKKLDLQRDVVRNERREGYDNAPYGPANYLFWQFMFPTEHPYHFHVIGSHEDLIAATVEDVVAFYETYYVPNNATLVVAGDFDSKQVKPLIEGLFGSIPRGKEPPRRSAPPVGFERTERVTLTDDVQFPRITMAWHSPAFYRPGDAEMDLVAFALGSGENGRLRKRLVREERVAVDVSVYQTSLRLGSVFRLDVHVKPGVDLAAVERMIDEELARMREGGPSERELLRGRADIESSTYHDLESLRDVADRMNHYEAHLGRPDAIAWDLERYARATPASVRDVAREVLRPDRRLVLRVVPKTAPDPALPTRERRPPAFEPKAWSPPRPDVFELPNGLAVWHVRRAGLPLFSARLLLPGGSAATPRAQAGVAALAAQMLLEGAGDLDGLQFADALAVLGADLGAVAERESTRVDLGVLVRNADPALALMGRALRAARFEEAAFERRRGLHLQGLRRLLDDPPGLARRVATDAFFGPDDGHGKPVTGYPHTAAALTLAQVRAHHERFHGPRGATLLTAGDLSTEEVRALATKHFGAWTQTKPRPPLAPVARPQREGLRVLVVEKPGAAQTVVRFVHPGVAFQAEQRVPLQVLNTILGGSFTSRLNANLREKHGYTYGAWSQFAPMDGGGLFLASANVQTDKTGPALREFLAEFERIRAGGVTEAEVAKARETVRAEHVQAFESLDGVLGAYAPFARYGLAPAALARDLAQAAACEAAGLGGLAEAWVARPGGVLVLAGDRAAIAAALEGLDLPEPRYLGSEDALAGRLGD